jgi:alpha-L-fucosidase
MQIDERDTMAAKDPVMKPKYASRRSVQTLEDGGNDGEMRPVVECRTRFATYCRGGSRLVACFVIVLVFATGLLVPNLQAQVLARSPDSSQHPVKAIQDTETLAQRNARMAWWREARLGMFIHWGLYAIPAGTWNGKRVDPTYHSSHSPFQSEQGEWIMNVAKIPVADYKKLATQFNPTQFNADAWVSMAKASGVKYIVITAKHHDGFAMFKSDANKFNVVDATPFKRDPLKELAIACHKQGIKLGFYYSQDQDWTAPGGSAWGGHWNNAQEGEFATYMHTKVIPQLKELLTNYQSEDAPVDIWFDTPTNMTPELASEIVTLLNKYPHLIWNSRMGGGYQGDYFTPEQHIPPQGLSGRDWETCQPINDTWGYKSYDTNFKSSKTLLQNLIDIVSKGGNYLLNVGPDATGVIPQPEQDRLLAIGKWLKVNGEAIYGSGPGPFTVEHGSFESTPYMATQKGDSGLPEWVPAWDWRATAKAGKVYISIFQWPRAAFTLPAMQAKVSKAYMLADSKHTPLKVLQNANGVTVTLPATAPDPIASVLVLQTRPQNP